jgi:hypothetical protein
MGIRTFAAAAAILAAAPQASLAACTLSSFGEAKAQTCSSSECGSANAPKEISAISRGLFSENIGLFINDGHARWVGVDLDRSEIIEVERFAGARFPQAKPELRKMKQTATHYGREIRGLNSRMIEFVRKKSVDDSVLANVVCAANELWAYKPDPNLPRLIGPMGDTHNKVYLVDRGTIKDFGGPGELTEAPRKLRALLEGMQ